MLRDLTVLQKQVEFDVRLRQRIYDVHIAEVARSAGAKVIVTDNRRHFLSALRHDLRVEAPSEFLAGLTKPSR